MVTGYNICNVCKGKIILNSKRGNKQESLIKNVCLGCYNKTKSLKDTIRG